MRASRADDVLYEVVDGQAVLVDPGGMELLTLNEVATLIWEALEYCDEPETLAAYLMPRLSGVGDEQLEVDIAGFLEQLRARGLVVDRA